MKSTTQRLGCKSKKSVSVIVIIRLPQTVAVKIPRINSSMHALICTLSTYCMMADKGKRQSLTSESTRAGSAPRTRPFQCDSLGRGYTGRGGCMTRWPGRTCGEMILQVSGACAHFKSRGIHCPFVPDCPTPSSLEGRQIADLLCMGSTVNSLGSLSMTFLSCDAPLMHPHCGHGIHLGPHGGVGGRGTAANTKLLLLLCCQVLCPRPRSSCLLLASMKLWKAHMSPCE